MTLRLEGDLLLATVGIAFDPDPTVRARLVRTLSDAHAAIFSARSLREVLDWIVVGSPEFVVMSGATLDAPELSELFAVLHEHGRGCHVIIVGTTPLVGSLPTCVTTIADDTPSRLVIECLQAVHACRGHRRLEHSRVGFNHSLAHLFD